MIYIICAFETEARAIIDAYRLVKQQNPPYTIFTSSEIVLLISDMGQVNARMAAEYLLSNFSIQENDCFLNLGICAANEKYPIGSLLQIKNIMNKTESFALDPLNPSILTVSCFSANEPVDKIPSCDIAEMEALSLHQGIRSSFAPHQISFLKIVSDHFKPVAFKKQFIIQLVQNNIKEIKAHIDRLKGEHRES